MKKLIALVAILGLIGLQGAFAQTRSIKGTVTSKEDGMGLPGVNVAIKGTTIGTATDGNGNFTLNVSTEATTLVFSSISYQTIEIPIQDVVNVALEADTKQIDEVFVVAYGTAKKKSFTGSASVVKAENIEKVQTSNLTKTLEGRVAGVQIVSASGQPGASTEIRIRGIGSINASSEPLIIVDGMPYEGNINSISSQDVESMTVLKDAASNALYGARGANGVILITTKKGTSNKVRVSFDAKLGRNERSIPEYSIMTNPVEYYETYWEAYRNGLISPTMTSDEAGVEASNTLIDKLSYNITNVANDQIIDPLTGKFKAGAKILYQDNWGDEMIKSNTRQEYNLSISGAASENTNYYLSAGYLDDNGIIVNSNFKRYSTRLRVESQVKSWFKAGGNAAFVNTKTNAPDVDPTSGVNMFYASRVMAPIYPMYVRDASGNKTYDLKGRPVYDYGTTLGRPVLSMTNPLGSQGLDKDLLESNYLNGGMFGEITFLKDFVFSGKVGIENRSSRAVSYRNGEYGQFEGKGGNSTITARNVMSINSQQTLSWTKQLNKHNINVLVGHEAYSTNENYLNGTKERFIYPDIYELDNAILNPTTGSGSTNYAIEGYLAKLDYNYVDKYYLSGSFRRDASSRFSPENRWGNFWSVGASWRIKEESFLKDVSWISSLKYKISYGAQGNDGLTNLYPYLDQYIVVNNGGQLATKLYYKGNKDISWEKNFNFNTGIEFAFLDNRIEGGIEVFQRKVKDMLFNRPLPATGGITSFPDNIGDMKNIGYEVELKGTLVRTDKISWSMGINATGFKNEITKLPPEKKESGIVDGRFKLMEGHSRYDYYTKEYAGVDETTGEAMWYMDEVVGGILTGKKITTTEYDNSTDYFQGSALPKVYGGLYTTVEAYGFDFSINCSYQLGGKGYDGIYASLMHSGDDGTNWATDIRNRWTPTNTKTDVPKLLAGEAYANASSSRFFISSNYFSIQNITLGYTLPKNISRKGGLDHIRVYFVADNVYLMSKRKGYDPRQSWTGASGDFNYSPIRTISGGIQIKF